LEATVADPDPVDPLPAFRAMIDQNLMLAPELARTAFAWYSAFVEAGFTLQQALYLTAAQMTSDVGQAP
jgi:hypothetical protein